MKPLLLGFAAGSLFLSAVASAVEPGPAPGTAIPDFSLPDQNGAVQTFDTLKGPKGMMLIFVRSADWCPFCKSQLVELERNRESIRGRGLGLATISYDSAAILKNFAQRKTIQFPLLSDEKSEVIRKFGLLNEEVPKNSPFYGVTLPVTYVVDAKGIVRTRHFEDDVKRRFTVGNILSQDLGIRTGSPSERVTTKHLALTMTSSDPVARAGDRIRLTLEVDLPARMHVYAPGVKSYIPVEWTMDQSAAYEPLAASYPSPEVLHLKAINETVPVFAGKWSAHREIVIAQPKELKAALEGNLLTLHGSFRYQACDDTKCYIPESVPLTWKLRFEPHDPTRAPVELQRK